MVYSDLIKAPENDTICVMSYNVQSIPSSLVPSTNLGVRKKIIPQFIKKIVNKYSVKILILQEMFEKSLYLEVKNVLLDILPHSTGVIGTKREYQNWTTCFDKSEMPFHLTNGGVCIFSVFKIVEKHQMVFKNAKNTCAFSRKGACLAVMNVGNRLINVVGTHLQAFDGPSMEIRKLQFLEILMWMDYLFNNKIDSHHHYDVKRDLPFILAGDLNTCCINQRPDFDLMLFQSKMTNFVSFQHTMNKEDMEPTYCTHTNDYCKISNTENFSHIYDYILIGPDVKIVQPQRIVRDKLKAPVSVRRFYLHCIGASKKRVYNPSDHYPVYSILAL